MSLRKGIGFCQQSVNCRKTVFLLTNQKKQGITMVPDFRG